MAQDALPCIVCGKALRNEFPDDVENQPRDGVAATSHGNYGSTVFDPMNGELIEFNVCDPCLTKAGEQGRVLSARDRLPVTYENVGVVGWQQVPPIYVKWTADLPGYGNDNIHLGEEDLGEPLPAGMHLNFTAEELVKFQKDFDRLDGTVD